MEKRKETEMEKINWKLTIEVWVLLALVVALCAVVFIRFVPEEMKFSVFFCGVLIWCCAGLYLSVQERFYYERQYLENRLRVAE